MSDQTSSASGIELGGLIEGYRHAGRQTITVDDVMLLSRRNEGLEAVLRAFVDSEQDGKQKMSGGRR